MKKVIPLLLVALLFGIGGYFAGVRSTINTVKSADIAALMWITSIHQFLEKGEYDRAKKICFDSANIHYMCSNRWRNTHGPTCTSFLCGNS